MQSDGADVVIVGAGVIGCATAYFLSKEGMKVVVVEQERLKLVVRPSGSISDLEMTE